MESHNICIATTGYYPKGMASTYRIHCYAKALQEMGTQVKVVSTMPQQTYAGKRWWYSARYDKIPFTIVWNNGKSESRWLNYIKAEINSYILLLYCLFTVRQYDVLWLYGMGFIPRLILLPLLHLVGKKVILEVNEYPYSTLGNKYTRIPFIRKMLERGTFIWVFPQLDGVVVISEKLKQLVKKYATSAEVLKVPILIDASRQNSVKTETYRHLDYPYLFHAGSLSEQKDGILSMVKAYIIAAKEMKKIEIKFHLVITNKVSLMWEKVKTIIDNADLTDQLVVTGYLHEKELLDWMSHSTVLLVNKPQSLQNQYNFPTKLGDYLISGRPVIVAAKGSELNHYLKNGKNCLVVPPNDEVAMADKIIEMIKQPQLAISIGAKGCEMALKNFNYNAHAGKIDDFISKL